MRSITIIFDDNDKARYEVSGDIPLVEAIGSLEITKAVMIQKWIAKEHSSKLLHSDQNPERSVATEDASSNQADKQNP